MKRIGQRIIFAIVGVPGAALFAFSSFALLGKIFDPRADLPSTGVLLFACSAGFAATLVGIGKIKEWFYGLVLISFPLSFWFWALVNPNMVGGLLLMLTFVAAVAAGTLRVVHYYYRKRISQF